MRETKNNNNHQPSALKSVEQIFLLDTKYLNREYRNHQNISRDPVH